MHAPSRTQGDSDIHTVPRTRRPLLLQVYAYLIVKKASEREGEIHDDDSVSSLSLQVVEGERGGAMVPCCRRAYTQQLERSFCCPYRQTEQECATVTKTRLRLYGRLAEDVNNHTTPCMHTRTYSCCQARGSTEYCT